MVFLHNITLVMNSRCCSVECFRAYSWHIIFLSKQASFPPCDWRAKSQAMCTCACERAFIFWSGEMLPGTGNIVDCGAMIGWAPCPSGLRGSSRASLFSLASVFQCLRCEEENLQPGVCWEGLWGLLVRVRDLRSRWISWLHMWRGWTFYDAFWIPVIVRDGVSYWKKGDMLEGSCWPLFPLPPLQVGELCRSDGAERPGSFSLWTQGSSIFVCPLSW